jgi:hypothetical protein
VDSSSAPVTVPNPTGLVHAITVTALVAGTLDYAAAITNYLLNGGREPIRIAWYIASSLLPRETAYGGGYVTAAFGLLVHYLIATGWTVLFFLVYPRVALLRRSPALVSVIYGAFVWAMMNQVLEPLTRITPGPFNLTAAATAAAILMVCIGLPNALLARRHFAQTT